MGYGSRVSSTPLHDAAPASHEVTANGLRHHVLEWPAEGTPAGGPPIVLLHGFMDAAGSFDLLAPRLSRAGHRVLAPDLRGFGKTGWVGAGGYYHFWDYIADLEGVRAALGLDKMLLVGHSMGGSVTTLYCSAMPERVPAAVLVEGCGPPDTDPAHQPDRLRRWLRDLEKIKRQDARSIESMDEARERLKSNHTAIPDELLATRVVHLVTTNAEGGLEWAFDPLHRTTSPAGFQALLYKAYAARIECPVLYVGGGPTGFHPTDEAERLAVIKDLEHKELDGAGHMIHWTRPAELAELVLGFFARRA